MVIAAVKRDRTLAQLAEQFEDHIVESAARGWASDVECEQVYLRAYEGVSESLPRFL